MQQHPPVLALHETMELHELLNFKTVCLLKSKMMQGLVHDEDLKALMKLDVQQSMAAITAMQDLYARAPIQVQIQ